MILVAKICITKKLELEAAMYTVWPDVALVYKNCLAHCLKSTKVNLKLTKSQLRPTIMGYAVSPVPVH
jgi:hypothetical protein